jgi:hypothetical protein
MKQGNVLELERKRFDSKIIRRKILGIGEF